MENEASIFNIILAHNEQVRNDKSSARDSEIEYNDVPRDTSEINDSIVQTNAQKKKKKMVFFNFNFTVS
jgi:hypothetical protein